MKSEERLLDELREAAAGLSMMSESDYPVEVIRWEARAGGVTPELLRAAAGAETSAPITEQSAAEFFRVATAEPAWKSEAELATARRFQRLLGLLEENLEELRAYRVGEINIPVYVVGRAPSGSLIGVSTRVVET
jgi:hypothetical protein